MTKKLILIASLLFGMLYSPNFYGQTVTIGTQVWSTKNLDVSTFRNGDSIMHAKTNEHWLYAMETRKAAWCYYKNDPANGTKYGKLYNWHAVNDPRGLAPVGYHIPTKAEWGILSDYLGGYSIGGNKMKSVNGWNSRKSEDSKTCPNCFSWNQEYRKKVPCHTCKDTRSVSVPVRLISGNGSNSSGFKGLPGGMRNSDGHFGIGEEGKWWSSTEADLDIDPSIRREAVCYFLNNRYQSFYEYGHYKSYGLSVRCLKDVKIQTDNDEKGATNGPPQSSAFDK